MFLLRHNISFKFYLSHGAFSMQIHFRKPFWFDTITIAERKVKNFFGKFLFFVGPQVWPDFNVGVSFGSHVFWEGFSLQLFVYSATRVHCFLLGMRRINNAIFQLVITFLVDLKNVPSWLKPFFQFLSLSRCIFLCKYTSGSLLISYGRDWWAKCRKRCFFSVGKFLFFVGQVWSDFNVVFLLVLMFLWEGFLLKLFV